MSKANNWPDNVLAMCLSATSGDVRPASWHYFSGNEPGGGNGHSRVRFCAGDAVGGAPAAVQGVRWGVSKPAGGGGGDEQDIVAARMCDAACPAPRVRCCCYCRCGCCCRRRCARVAAHAWPAPPGYSVHSGADGHALLDPCHLPLTEARLDDRSIWKDATVAHVHGNGRAASACLRGVWEFTSLARG